jgi:hypothetical protein
MDPSSAKIRILPTTGVPNTTVPLNPVALSASMQKDLLQNKYEKFRKGIKT